MEITEVRSSAPFRGTIPRYYATMQDAAFTPSAGRSRIAAQDAVVQRTGACPATKKDGGISHHHAVGDHCGRGFAIHAPSARQFIRFATTPCGAIGQSEAAQTCAVGQVHAPNCSAKGGVIGDL